MKPSIETLRELLEYDPETGVLTWKTRPRSYFKQERDWKWWNKMFAGTTAGSYHRQGYLKIGIFGRTVFAHRIAWAMHTGAWPEQQLDHISGKPGDNRFENLREVDNTEQQRNLGRAKNNTSGIMGVCWHKSNKKWIAQISVNGRLKHLGYFEAIDDAAAAVKKAHAENGYHKNHGQRLSHANASAELIHCPAVPA